MDPLVNEIPSFPRPCFLWTKYMGRWGPTRGKPNIGQVLPSVPAARHGGGNLVVAVPMYKYRHTFYCKPDPCSNYKGP